MIAPLRYIISLTKRSKLTIITIGIVIMFITSTLIIVYSFEMSNRDLVKRFESRYYIISSEDNLLNSHVPLGTVNGTYVWVINGKINNESTYIAGIYDPNNLLGYSYQCNNNDVILGRSLKDIKGYAELDFYNKTMDLKIKRYMNFQYFPSYWCIVNYSLFKNMSKEPNFIITNKNLKVDDFETRSMTSLTQFYSKTAEEISFDLLLMDMISIVVVYLFVNALLTIEIRENTKKIGIMKAIGSTNYNIVGIYLLRSLYIGFIGMLIGFSLGVVLSYLLSSTIPLFGVLTYFNIYVPHIVIIADFIISVVGSGFASITPIRRAVRINIIRGIRGARA